MSEQLMEYFNKQPRLGTLSTADKNGKVDSTSIFADRGKLSKSNNIN